MIKLTVWISLQVLNFLIWFPGIGSLEDSREDCNDGGGSPDDGSDDCNDGGGSPEDGSDDCDEDESCTLYLLILFNGLLYFKGNFCTLKGNSWQHNCQSSIVQHCC